MSGTKRIGNGARRPIQRPRVAARIAVAALAVFAAAMPATSAKSSEDCVPTSPETMLGIIDAYIQAQIFHPEQGPAVPLAVDAPNCQLVACTTSPTTPRHERFIMPLDSSYPVR